MAARRRLLRWLGIGLSVLVGVLAALYIVGGILPRDHTASALVLPTARIIAILLVIPAREHAAQLRGVPNSSSTSTAAFV